MKDSGVVLIALSALFFPSVSQASQTDRHMEIFNAAASNSLRATKAEHYAPPSASADTERTITGTVVDATDGEPLVGATLQVEGDSKRITTTDINGAFNITIDPSKKNILLVSYIGYTAVKIPVDKMAEIDIKLSPADNTLNEVVVVGSGVQKKVSVTGAISSIKGDALQMSTSTLTNALAGKFAGVYANNTSGQPGSGAEFYIRGISNFAGKSATPLILLDDVEISSSDLNHIPAENIESFSVLKDASATAIYGARGANGVMIITTKGGDYNSKTNVNFTFENAFNILGDFPKFVDGATFMEIYNKAQHSRNPLLSIRYQDEQIERTRSGANPYLYPDVDWGEVLFKKLAMRQKANINISGGGNKVKYYMSLEMQHENGHYNTKKLYSWNNNIQNYNYNFQSNIAYKLTPTTTVSMNLNAQVSQNSRPNISAESLFNYVLNTNPILMTPYYPAREGYDYVLFGTYERSPGEFMENPFAALNTSFYQQNANTINAVIKLDQDLDFITKGLRFQGWINFKNWSTSYYTRSVDPYTFVAGNIDPEDWTNPIFELRKGANGSKYISESGITRNSDNTFEFQANINWNRRIDMSEISAMVLYRMREYRSVVLPNRNQGVSGRVTYDFGHRYLAEFNFGYNGTERLAKGYRFGFFPAGSIGWVISNESFWEPLSQTISYLKIRGSYGLVGSDDIVKPNGQYFLYIDKITGNNLDYLTWRPGGGGATGWGTQYGGPQMTYYAVTDLGWEKVKKLDIGLDLRLWGDLSVTLDYFRDLRYDMFMQRESWPYSLGYGPAVPYGAVGKVVNRGFDGSVTYNKALNHETSVSFTGSFTYNKNKLLSADENNWQYPWLFSTGLPMNYIRGYVAEGLFQSQEEIDKSPEQLLGSKVMVGDIKYSDLNGDGKIDNSDRTMISEYGKTPMLQYGFGATVNWRKFDFGFFFTGSAKRKIMINGLDPFMRTSAIEDRNVLQWVADNYFDPEKENFDAAYPRLGLTSSDISNNQVASTYWLRDGSFLRLRNVEIGWSFKNGRIYASGVNLLNFTSFKLWDPELSNWNSYPLQKTINVGLQVKL